MINSSQILPAHLSVLHIPRLHDPLKTSHTQWCKITKLRELALTITQYFLSYKWSLEYKNDFVKDKDKLLVPPKLIPKKWIEKKVYEK